VKQKLSALSIDLYKQKTLNSGNIGVPGTTKKRPTP
jgi:hypothetical protein